jgi:outer membrane lipoprotein-sorting protein
MTNERNDKDLAELLKAARAIPGSSARQKAVSAMAEAAPAAGSRRRSSISWRRAVPAAAFIVVLVASGFWLLPKRQTVALADVARAMANVQSAHLVGWRVDEDTGDRHAIEAWFEGPSKYRIWTEGREDVADDGETLVLVSSLGSVGLPRIAEIRRSGDPYDLEDGMTYLDLLKGAGVMQAALDNSGARLTESIPVTLPDGRTGADLVLSVAGSADYPTWVLTVDADTDLLVQWEIYADGELWEKVERTEYDVDIPDSIFTVEIPEDALVFDQRWSAPPEVRAEREAMADRLKEAGGAFVCKFVDHDEWVHGTSGSGHHSKLFFRWLDRDPMIIYYLPDENVYHVLGRALAYLEDGSGFWQVVEDAEFVPATPPDTSPEIRIAEWESRLSPEVKAEREAKRKELRAAGGQPIADIPSGRCSSGSHPKVWFKCLADDGIEVYYLPDRNVYYVIGKALVWSADFEEVVEDAEVPAPGEPEGLP